MILKKREKKENSIPVRERLRRMFTSHENVRYLRKGSYSSALTVIVLAVIVVINLIVTQLPSSVLQIDVSAQKLYTITEDTKEALKDLSSDVTLYLITRNGNEDDTIDKLLNRYEDLSSHIQVVQKDPDVYPQFANQYTDQNISENSVIVVSGEKSRVVSYSDMWETSFDSYTYQQSTTGFDGEGQITSAISYVISDSSAKIYWVTGHGELTLAETSSTFQEAVEKNNVEIEELSLMTEDVPEDAACLVVMSPMNDFSAEEAEKMISYLENGGNALIMSDYSEEDRPNFDSILNNYGVQRSDGVVIEGDSQHYFPQYPYYLLPEIESDDLTSAVQGTYVMVPLAQAILPLDSYRDSIMITSLLRTTGEAYIEDDLQNSTLTKKEDSVTGPFDLGVKITEEVDGGTTNLLYFSSSNMLNEQFDMAVSGSNTKLISTALISLCDVETSSAIPSKSLSYSRLMFTAAEVNLWSIVTMAVIPAVFLIVGFVIWMKRRKQ